MKLRISFLCWAWVGLAMFWPSQSVVAKERLVESKLEEFPSGAKASGNIIIPFISYALETRLGYGVIDTVYFHLDESERPSSVRILGMGTQNNQQIFRVRPELFFHQDQFRLVAELGYINYPDQFYGLGNQSQLTDAEAIAVRYLRSFVSLRKRISGPYEAGFLYEFERDLISFNSSLPLLGSGKIYGAQGGTVSGLGLIGSMDTRNRIFYPEQGVFHQASLAFFGPYFGSDFTYQRFRLDLRSYWTLFSDHVLAVQWVTQLIQGQPAMYQQSVLGGNELMRGYWEGRFRDLHMIASQVEYRLPLFWRMGMVGFLGLGNVSQQAVDLVTTGFKPSYGVGLRFAVDQTQKVNARMDVAWGSNTSGFYLQLGEVF